jgi:hypothetical protein
VSPSPLDPQAQSDFNISAPNVIDAKYANDGGSTSEDASLRDAMNLAQNTVQNTTQNTTQNTVQNTAQNSFATSQTQDPAQVSAYDPPHDFAQNPIQAPLAAHEQGAGVQSPLEQDLGQRLEQDVLGSFTQAISENTQADNLYKEQERSNASQMPSMPIPQPIQEPSNMPQSDVLYGAQSAAAPKINDFDDPDLLALREIPLSSKAPEMQHEAFDPFPAQEEALPATSDDLTGALEVEMQANMNDVAGKRIQETPTNLNAPEVPLNAPEVPKTEKTSWFSGLQSGLFKSDSGEVSPNVEKSAEMSSEALEPIENSTAEVNLDNEFEKLFSEYQVESAATPSIAVESDLKGVDASFDAAISSQASGADNSFDPKLGSASLQENSPNDPYVKADAGNAGLAGVGGAVAGAVGVGLGSLANSKSAEVAQNAESVKETIPNDPVVSDPALNFEVEQPRFERAIDAPAVKDPLSQPMQPQQADVNNDADMGALFADAPIHSDNSKRGGMRLGGVIIALALLGSVGALAWSYLGNSNKPVGDEQVAIIKADPEPVKVKPENPGGEVIANQEREVYQQVDGENKPNNQEVLTNNREEPDEQVVKQSQSEEGFIKPRVVKTVVVKPDGTILTTETPADSSAAVNETQVATNQTTDTQEATAQAVTTDAITGDATDATENTITEQVSVPEIDPVTEPKVENPPLIKARPAKPVVKPTEVVNIQPITTTVKAPKPVISSVPSSTYVMQVAAEQSAAAAQTTYNRLLRRYNNLLAGRGVDIKRVKLDGKGVFHRIRIPVGTRQQAANLCEQLKAAGGQCFVTR